MRLSDKYKAYYENARRRYKEWRKLPWWFEEPEPVARFTGWLVVYTGVLFIVGALQLSTLKKTDDTLRANERAYVVVNGINASPIVNANQKPTLWNNELVIENSGNTPTQKLKFVLKNGMADSQNIDPADMYEKIFNVDGREFPLGPRGRDISKCTTLPPGDELDKTQRVCSGIIYYNDVLDPDDPPHITKFCFASYSITENGEKKPMWRRCPYWNCADKECIDDKKRFNKFRQK